MEYKLILSSDNGSIDLYNDPDIFVVDMDGVSPEVTNVFTDIYNYDGSMYNNAYVPARHISIVIQFYNRDVEAARLRLFDILNPKNAIKLRYVSDNQDRYIMARLDGAPVVWGDLSVKGQINLTCSDPYWMASDNDAAVISGTESCFEFPFEIPEEGMEFGRLGAELIVNVFNDGITDSGAVFTFKAVTVCSNPCIKNIETGEYIKVIVDMVTDDVLEVCTMQGKKSIFFTHNGIRHNYFNKRAPGSVFMQVHRGDNYYKYTVDTGDDHAVDITCKFDKKYGGI